MSKEMRGLITLFKELLTENINKTAGVWSTDEKFEDGSDFKIKFKVSDVIDLAKDKPIKSVNPKSIDYDFDDRVEDELKTKERVMKADLSYPIIVVQNEKGKLFTILDGTHRLEKALSLKLNKIDVKVMDKEDLKQFKVDDLNENVINDGFNNIENIIKSFVNSDIGKKYTKHDCKTVTRAFVKWASDNNIKAEVIILAPPSRKFIKDNPQFKGKSGKGDSHIMPIINGNAIDFTVRQFGVGRPFENPLITRLSKLESVYGKFGYFTGAPGWFLGGKSSWKGPLESIPSDIFNQDFGDEIL